MAHLSDTPNSGNAYSNVVVGPHAQAMFGNRYEFRKSNMLRYLRTLKDSARRYFGQNTKQ